MKRGIGIFFIAVAFFGAGYAGWFAWHNLRGAGPAFTKAPHDITRDFSTPAPSDTHAPINSTGFPLTVPAGFSMSVFAKDLVAPRVLARDSAGTILTSVTGKGRVVALPDADHDGVADRTVTVLSGLNSPHGLAFQGNRLYVAESDGVSTYDYDPGAFTAKNRQKIIDLPNKGFHFTRTIGFGPDGKLYVSIGSSCNVCLETDPRRAAIYVANDDGSDFRPYATGLRNAVFFTWSPFGNRMWATVMGRDALGDDIPPDTIDIVGSGDNFGWPYCYGKQVWDRSFDPSQKARDFCATTAPSYIDYQAHSAPLGLAFVPPEWPDAYRTDLLVAMHGSWNRTKPTGYKIVRFRLDAQGKYEGAEDFITGWLTDSGVLGRPVDLLFDSEGSLFVSDDKAGVIYRVRPQ